MAYYTAGIIGSYFRGATTPNGFDISGSTVSASNVVVATRIRDVAGALDISGGNITVSGTINAGAIASSGISPTNIIVPGYVRNAMTPTTLDISGGNISNSGTTRTANAIVSGYLRNALTPTTYDISGGNISNSGTTRSSNFLGAAITSNSVGGIVMSNGLLRSDTSDTFMVAAGQTLNTLAYSSNGTTWIGVGGDFATKGNDVAWNGSLWVAAGEDPTFTMLYSTDGITWAGGVSAFSVAGTGVAWGGGLWVATGAGANTLATSTDGITWSGLGTSVFTSAAYSVAYNGSMWVAVGQGGNTIAYSMDGASWVGLGTSIFSTRGLAIAWNGSVWVAGGQGTNRLAYSSDGINWSLPAVAPFSTAVYRVAWNGSLWVAAGEGTNVLAYSTDANTWYPSGSTVFSTSARGVAWNGSFWVATGIGSSHTLATSSNGINWTGLGNSTFGIGLGIASRRYVLPVSSSIVFDASDGNIAYTGSIVSANLASSNRIGGVTMSNSNVTLSNIVASGYIRNALTATQFDISGGNISNSGRILNGAGTVSAPSYTFGNDASLGLYDPATNVLGVVTAGVERMRVDATGQVGINTTVPGANLDVSGILRVQRSVGGNNNLIQLATLSNGAPIIRHGIGIDPDTGSGNGGGNLYFNAFTDLGGLLSTPLTIQRSTGNVGIGMGTNALSNYRIMVRGTGTTNGGLVFASSTNPIPFVGMVYDETSDTIGFRTNTGAADLNCNAMAVTRTTGRVGIGTTGPGQLLDVSGGSIQTTGQLIFNTGDADKMYLTNFLTGGSRISHTTGWSVDIAAGSNNATSGQVRILRGAVGGHVETARFNSNGRLGIGVTAPGYALDVCAGITTASINMTTWPRTTLSTSFFGIYSTVETNAIRWTTSNSMSTELMTTASNLNNGTYFQINKNGIWSFNVVLFGTGAPPILWIDSSTNIAHNGANWTQTPPIAINVGDSTQGAIGTSYIGFLPSNAGIYYKVKVSGTTPFAGFTGARLTIAYLGETPTVTGVPY